MNWLTDFVRPRIRKLMQKEEAPDNLWDKCPACEQMIFHRELLESLNVCPKCAHHLPLSATARAESLFDDKQYKRLDVPSVPTDPLKFRDRKKYTDRLKEARTKTGQNDAILLTEGTIQDLPLITAIFDFRFVGGSMGLAAGEALIAGAERALAKKATYLVISSSGGARMQEGMFSLMQMPRSVIAVSMLREAGLPFISLMSNPTMGGVSASFAALGDINLAEPGALIGFTGARVIQETTRSTLPEGFQSADFQLEHGAVDQVVHRNDLRETLGHILHITTAARKNAKSRR